MIRTVRRRFGRGHAPSLGASASENGSTPHRARHDQGPNAEAAFERLLSKLRKRAPKGRGHVVLVVSAVPGEGATSVAEGMARRLRRGSHDRVLQIATGDVPSSQVGALLLRPRLEATSAQGGSEEGERASAEALSDDQAAAPAEALPLDPRGEPLPEEGIPSLFEELRARFQFVIIDARPVTRFTDAALLAPHCDSVILVVRAESTRWEVAEEAVRVLEDAGGQVWGAILNRRRFRIPRWLYRRI